MIDWRKLKEDVGNGIKSGIEAIKQGSKAATDKAGEMTDDVKKKLKIHELKKSVHENMAELGARVYQMEKEKQRTITDVTALAFLSKIDSLEAEIKSLEN